MLRWIIICVGKAGKLKRYRDVRIAPILSEMYSSSAGTWHKKIWSHTSRNLKKKWSVWGCSQNHTLLAVVSVGFFSISLFSLHHMSTWFQELYHKLVSIKTNPALGNTDSKASGMT